MNGAVTGIAVIVALAAVVVAIYALARRNRPAGEPGQPDANTEKVVAGLMAELRKWQAEAAHWKATAQRLQRELDQR